MKDEDELDSIRRAAQIADIAFERFVDEGGLRRPNRGRPRLADGAVPARRRRRRRLVLRPRRVGPECGQAPHRSRGAAPRARRDRDRRLGLHGRRLRVRLHAHTCHRPSAGRADARLRGLPRRAAGGARCGSTRSIRAQASTRRRATGSTPPASATRSGTGSVTGSGCSCTRIRASPRSPGSTLAVGNVVTVEPGIYLLRARRDPDRGPRRRPGGWARDPDHVHEGLAHGRLDFAADGRDRQHEPVQERHAHRDRGRRLAHRRVPAREARQGRRVRADQGEEHRHGRGRRQDLPGRREVPADAHRGEERPVPLRLRRRRRVHGGRDV